MKLTWYGINKEFPIYHFLCFGCSQDFSLSFLEEKTEFDLIWRLFKIVNLFQVRETPRCHWKSDGTILLFLGSSYRDPSTEILIRVFFFASDSWTAENSKNVINNYI